MEMDKKALPEGWRLVKLADVCEKQTGIRDPRLEPEKTFRYIDISRVDNKLKRITEAKQLIGKEAPSRARKIVRENDVILSTTRPNLNAIATVPKELDSEICSTGFCVLRSTSLVDATYLFLYLQSGNFVETLSDLVKGALYPAVTDSQVMSQKIPLPPLPEQKRIAAVLTERLAAVERARKASEARLQAARALPAAYLREVFESEEARGWDVAQLGELVSSSLRTGISKPEKPDSGKKCLTLSAVRSGVLLLDQVKSVDVTDAEAKRNEIRAGAFYVVRGNGNKSLVGRGGIAPNQCSGVIFPDLLFEIIPNPNILSIDFLRWAWDSQSVRSQIEEKAKTAAGIYKINQKNLASIELPIPPLLLQKQVATVLSNKISKVTCIQKMIFDELVAVGTMSASYLRQAFSGTL